MTEPIILTEEQYNELMRVFRLRQQGCTCTPGRLSGGPAVHAEDFRCPLHRPLFGRVTDTQACWCGNGDLCEENRR